MVSKTRHRGLSFFSLWSKLIKIAVVSMWFQLFVIAVVCATPSPPQCPTPEDRAHARYNGQTCSLPYGCCFSEQMGNETVSCCYAYGSDGPYKCCGSPSTGEIILAVAIGFIFMSIIIGMVFMFWYMLCHARRKQEMTPLYV
jgi:hypothetical protein